MTTDTAQTSQETGPFATSIDDVDAPCPCGSGATLGACCAPIINRDVDPETAEAAMRSRYTAYALTQVDWVVASNHPDTSEDVDPEEIERWSSTSEWLGLAITDTEAGGPDDEAGYVSFRARYRMDGQLHEHRERALFQRHDGAWRFHTPFPDEEIVELAPVTPRSTVGRNDPCTCGSGKKYKKCCG